MKTLKILICYLLLTSLLTATAAAEPVRMLILPVRIFSDQDLNFLNHGIRNMIATRLGAVDEVQPVSQAETDRAVAEFGVPADEPSAIALGEKTDAQFVLRVSLTVFGDSISTDAKCFDVLKQKAVVLFNETGSERGDVIHHVSHFVDKINTDLFNLKPETAAKVLPNYQAPPADTTDTRQHPETLIEGAMDGGGGTFVRENIQTNTLRWISQSFKMQINGLSIGDVNGDQRQDIIIAGPHQVVVQDFIDNRLVRIGEVTDKNYNWFLSVDTSDVNNDNTDEIYVSNFPRNGDKLQSFVLEYSGRQLTKTVENESLFYGVFQTRDRGKVLIGQKAGKSGATISLTNFFQPGVYELQRQGNVHHMESRLNSPRTVNVFNFAFGDPMNSGADVFTTFSGSNILRILSPGGSEEWSSEESYGGTANYFRIENPERADDELRFYIPPRILVTDLNGDGKNEVITAKNQEASGVLGRLKVYKNGYIECLTWNGMSLAPKWRTEKATKYISDLAVGDVDQDGTPELVYAVVVKPSWSMDAGKSYIVIEDIPAF
ncbi:MAG: VCBS repeat-containing protein [Desulfobacteraceae bacterium]|nr:VCBS repeat-containing protein [Desulfobacteraceae bacterium]